MRTSRQLKQEPEKQAPPAPESKPWHARTFHDSVQDNMAEMRRRKQVADVALTKELAELRDVQQAIEERIAKAVETSTWSLAEELQPLWQAHLETQEAADEGADVVLFLQSVERPNWVAFEITTRGMACGPVWSTSWTVLDLSCIDEEGDE